MPDFRAFCIPPVADPAEIELSREESHHLVAVNRARPGDPVIVFDGAGTEWSCELARAQGRSALLKVSSRRTASPLAHRLTLAQAMPKGPAMEAIVRKATELGAARIVPLETERTQVHWDSGREERKNEKWRQAAIEAAKQCGNPWLPEIAPVQSLAAFLSASRALPGLRLVASLEPGSRPLKALLPPPQPGPISATWLVGPEGDFSPSEYAAIREAGYAGVSLGPLVLRCDTAAVAALSILAYELQDLVRAN